MKIGIGLPNPVPGTPGHVLVDWADALAADKKHAKAVELYDRAVKMAPKSTYALTRRGVYYWGLDKNDLPAQLCAFTNGVLRVEAMHEPGYFDLVHSHYWLSGQVGWVAKERWGVPLVHSMHTMAKVKNDAMADGDVPEPPARVIGEEQVVEAADRLIASTDIEAKQLVNLYDADPGRVEVVPPGVDLTVFRPRDTQAAREQLGGALVKAAVGRAQELARSGAISPASVADAAAASLPPTAATLTPVINAIHGDGFNPLWRQVLIHFNDGFTPHQFTSDTQVEAAASGPHPEITLTVTDEVYRCSVVGPK